MYNNKILFFIAIIAFFLFYPSSLIAQKYKVKTSSLQIRGMAATSQGIVLYGNGLVYLDQNGQVTYRDRLCEYLPSSSVIDIVTDRSGDVWVLTNGGLSHLTGPSSADLVISQEDIGDKEQFKDLFAHRDGSVYCLTKTGIYKAKGQTWSKVFDGVKNEISYLQGLVVHEGYIYAFDYNNIYRIDEKTGSLSKIKGTPEKNNFNEILLTGDGKVYVLSSRALYDIQGEMAKQIIAGSDLENGISFKTGAVQSADNIWLLTRKGIIYRYNGETWKKYNAPSQVNKKGYFKDVLLADNGHVWFSFSSDPLLLFNGTNWKPIFINVESDLQKMVRFIYSPNGVKYARDEDGNIFDLKSARLIIGNDRPFKEAYHIVSDSEDVQYWSTDKGLFKRTQSKWQVIEGIQKPGSLYMYDGKLFLSADKGFYVYENSKLTKLEDNVHYQGWNKIYGLRFFVDHTGRLMAHSSTRKGLISIYDGKEWQKLISAAGKGFGEILGIHTVGQKTYVIPKGNRTPAIFSDGKWSWMEDPLFEGEEIKHLYYCDDDSIWLHTVSNQMIVIRAEGIQIIKPPVENRPLSRLVGIVRVDDGVYDFHMGDGIIECDLD